MSDFTVTPNMIADVRRIGGKNHPYRVGDDYIVEAAQELAKDPCLVLEAIEDTANETWEAKTLREFHCDAQANQNALRERFCILHAKRIHDLADSVLRYEWNRDNPRSLAKFDAEHERSAA
jgi:hypothetical protein